MTCSVCDPTPAPGAEGNIGVWGLFLFQSHKRIYDRKAGIYLVVTWDRLSSYYGLV